MRNLLILCVIIVFGIIGSVIYVYKSEESENTSTNAQITADDNNSVSVEIKPSSENLNNTLSKSGDLKQKINAIKVQETEVDDSKVNNSLPNINMLWITIVSLIVAFLSILVSLYLYYWRYKLIVNQDFLIPEKVVAELGSQSEQFNKLSQYNIQVGQLIESQLKKSSAEISELKNILIQSQKTLNEKDDIISRYQQGYDNKIYKNFIGRFYRIYKFLTDLEQKKEIQNSDFNKIKILFDDAFEQSGVEIFYPDIGINYLDEGEILDDSPIIKLTTNEKEDNKVIEVNNPGLRFVEKEINNRVIIKSKVTILQFKEG
jgi:hypothetical protein